LRVKPLRGVSSRRHLLYLLLFITYYNYNLFARVFILFSSFGFIFGYLLFISGVLFYWACLSTANIVKTIIILFS